MKRAISLLFATGVQSLPLAPLFKPPRTNASPSRAFGVLAGVSLVAGLGCELAAPRVSR
ncbi:hypothetical protein [Halorubrum sp. GN11_10-6_MGM]|uniref:hypothetical protein n=1 Tax=Halorubrum sp. GN11_10-6_MGM TaxID=2518112 RepID=UPI00130DD550|nr:hypothetical protein [Halorubrum sp. GN11_10-6_MGM]